MTDGTHTTEPFARLPTAVSSVLAVVIGAIAIGLIAGTDLQRQALAIAFIGVISLVLGGRLWKGNRSGVGAVLAICGCLLVVVSVGYAVTRPPQIIHRLELLPGILGLWVLAGALVPVWLRRSRLLIDVGTGLLFVAVLTSGVVRGASTTALVIAAAATILAWDAAENAVSMGGQMGSVGVLATGRAEFVHVALSGAVAGGVVVVVLGVARLGIDGLPFAALVALLVAGIVLVIVSHR